MAYIHHQGETRRNSAREANLFRAWVKHPIPAKSTISGVKNCQADFLSCQHLILGEQSFLEVFRTSAVGGEHCTLPSLLMIQQQTEQVCLQVYGSSSQSSGCSCDSRESVYLCLVSPDVPSLFALQNQYGGHSNGTHCTKPPQANVVLRPQQTPGRLSVGSLRLSGSMVSRANPFHIH